METSINESILYSFKFQVLPFMTHYIHSISLKCRLQTNFPNLYWKCKSNSPAIMRHLLVAMAKNHHNHHSIERETEIKSTFLLWSSVKSMISPFLQCKSHSLTDLSLLPDITSVLLWENLANVLHQSKGKWLSNDVSFQKCVCMYMMYVGLLPMGGFKGKGFRISLRKREREKEGLMEGRSSFTPFFLSATLFFSVTEVRERFWCIKEHGYHQSWCHHQETLLCCFLCHR